MENRILTVMAAFAPGVNLGGPIKSVKAIVNYAEVRMDILTLNKDMGSKVAYDLPGNTWISFDNYRVYYATSYKELLRVLFNSRRNYEVLYLNSFFSPKGSVLPLIVANFTSLKVVLAVRGELYDETLAFNQIKKNLYLSSMSLFKLYRKVVFHSTEEFETYVIRKRFPDNKIILARPVLDYVAEYHSQPQKISEKLRVVFISRISKEKNLKFALDVIQSWDGDCIFDIYGPREDEVVWDECYDVISKNEYINYRGVLKGEKVREIFSTYDVFLFPTLRENFGHVVGEALSVGTRCIISDKLPWRDIDQHDLESFVIRDNNLGLYHGALNQIIELKTTESKDSRIDRIAEFQEYLSIAERIKENKNLFESNDL